MTPSEATSALIGEQAERRRRVDEDPVVALLHRRDPLLERALAPDETREGELGAGEVDRGDGKVDLTLVDHLVDRQPVDEDVVHRALDRVRVEPLAHRQVPLRIEIDCEHGQALLGKRDGEVEGRRRLRHATFLVGERDDPCHTCSFRGVRGRRPSKRLQEAHCGLLSGQASRVLLSPWTASNGASMAFLSRSTAPSAPPVGPGSTRIHASASTTSERSSASSVGAGARARSRVSIRSRRRSTARASSTIRR